MAMLRWILPIIFVATAQAQRTFDIVSIRPSDVPACLRGSATPLISPGRLNLRCAQLRSLIGFAYTGGLATATRRMQVIGGPSWLDSDFYDIIASSEYPATLDELTGPMLKALLAERFQLKAHIEERENPVFNLVVAKPNANLKAANPSGCAEPGPNNLTTPSPDQRVCGNARLTANKPGFRTFDIPGVTMAQFAGRYVEAWVRRPTVDKTGLAGRFDIRLDISLSPPPPPEENVPAAAAPGGIEDQARIALEDQLGLKLVPGRAPIDVVILDSINRPSDN
jgi:uncharacterized protein (TIGR03435 family)